MVAQIIKKQISSIEYREKKISWILFSLSICLIISYGLLLNGAVARAVSKESMQKQISSLDSKVNSLEFQYLSLKNGITLEMALNKGFVAVSSDKFATVDPTSKDLSLSINEN